MNVIPPISLFHYKAEDFEATFQVENKRTHLVFSLIVVTLGPASVALDTGHTTINGVPAGYASEAFCQGLENYVNLNVKFPQMIKAVRDGQREYREYTA